MRLQTLTTTTPVFSHYSQYINIYPRSHGQVSRGNKDTQDLISLLTNTIYHVALQDKSEVTAALNRSLGVDTHMLTPAIIGSTIVCREYHIFHLFFLIVTLCHAEYSLWV